nr:MAG TPA: Putative hydrolase-like Lipase/Acylhydrolase family protein, Structural [Caudoviricetes sp.]
MPIVDHTSKWFATKSKIDAALYLIKNIELNNVTPFTYGDGLTYYEVLSRLREVVSEVVEYVNEFGNEERRLVDDFNKKIQEFVKNQNSAYDLNVDRIKNATAAFESAAGKLMDSLLAEKFEKHPSGKFFTTTAKDGSQIAVASSQGMQDVLDELTTVRSTVNSNKANADRRLNDLESNSIVNRVSKYPHTLILGSSNAILTGYANGTWDEWCRSKGEVPHNYASNGGGFTSSEDNNFLTMLNNAATQISEFQRNLTGRCYIIDLIYDIRTGRDISQPFERFMQKLKEAFPNCKDIIVLPALYNECDANNDFNIARRCASTTNAIKRLATPHGAVVCEGSRSWFHNGQEAKFFTPEMNVHFTPTGYKYAQQQFDAWLRGGSGWVNYGWEDITGLANLNNVRQNNFLYAVCRRERDDVTLHATFEVGSVTNGEVLFRLPAWARPYTNFYVTMWQDSTAFRGNVNHNGNVIALKDIPAGTRLAIDASYSIF